MKDMICDECKIKIANYLELKTEEQKFQYSDPGIPFSLNLIRDNKLENTIWFRNRRLKQKLMISAHLFDNNSLFSLLPKEIIYSIIFPFYWHPINSIQDNNKNSNIILYSKFRSIFGVTSS